MKRWMVILSFKTEYKAEIASLVPAEQAHVRELISRQELEAIYIAADSSKVWLVMPGASEEAIEHTLSQFPMHQYFLSEVVALN